MLQTPTVSAVQTPQMSTTINPPQPIPFIPMVPPLANTFAVPVVPSVTSALVDNLINNNPTPVSTTTATTIVQEHPEVKSSPIAETNANTEAVPLTSQLFDQPTSPSQAFIAGEQQQVMNVQAEVIPSAPPATAQSFVNTEGIRSLKKTY